MTLEYKKNFLINILFAGTLAALAVVVSRFLLAYLLPFVIGVCVALFVQKPAAVTAARLRVNKSACAVVLTVLICVAVLAVLSLAVWVLGGKLAELIGRLPEYFAALQNSLEGIKRNLPSSGNTKTQIEGALSGAVDSLTASVTGLLSGAAAALIRNLPAFLISSIVTVVASCYIAKDFDRLKKFFMGIIPRERFEKIAVIKNIVTQNAAKFLKGYGIIAGITFLELCVAFAVLGIDKPVLKAFLVALVDALPVLGVGTVMVPWAIIEFLGRNFFTGAGLLVFYAVIIIVRNFIEPKIIGGQIGINPIFTLVSMFLGLKIAGIAGMIICPLTLTVAVEYYRKTLGIKSVPSEG